MSEEKQEEKKEAKVAEPAGEDKAGEEKEAAPSEAAEASKDAEAAAPSEPDWKDMYARLLADFDNYKKRMARDREDTYRFAEVDILKDIIPTVDNLTLALDKAENKDDAFVKGVSLVCESLVKALKEHGAEPFDALGKPLDTDKMEAIAHLPSEDVEEGKVSTEVKKGWMLKDKVLRVAQVVVSAGKKE